MNKESINKPLAVMYTVATTMAMISVKMGISMINIAIRCIFK